MTIYSVYLPPEHDGEKAAEEFQLLRDAKAPLALIFPPFWLAWHRLWLELLIYATVATGIGLLAVWQPLPPVFYLSAIPGFYLLLEGNELVRRKLERGGWRFAGVVDGQNRDEAEIRFLVENEKLLSNGGRRETLGASEKPVSVFSPPAPTGLFPE